MKKKPFKLINDITMVSENTKLHIFISFCCQFFFLSSVTLCLPLIALYAPSVLSPNRWFISLWINNDNCFTYRFWTIVWFQFFLHFLYGMSSTFGHSSRVRGKRERELEPRNQYMYIYRFCLTLRLFFILLSHWTNYYLDFAVFYSLSASCMAPLHSALTHICYYTPYIDWSQIVCHQHHQFSETVRRTSKLNIR